jgi:hypothetical protein
VGLINLKAKFALLSAMVDFRKRTTRILCAPLCWVTQPGSGGFRSVSTSGVNKLLVTRA